MKINISNVLANAEKALKRFPVCMAFLAALTVQLIVYIITESRPNAGTFFLSVGMLVALLLHLMTEKKEELSCRQILKNEKAAALWITSFVLLGADSFFLHLDDVTTSVGIAQSAAILALFLAVFFLPFRKENDDMMSWNFVKKLVISLCLGLIIGLVMLAGLSMLYYGTSVLFSFPANYKIFTTLATLCMVTLSSCIFFLRVPEGTDMFCKDTPHGSFLINVIRYLFLPLALLYMVVLYVYGIKILITWTLPKGMLSTMVSTLMFSIISITSLLYPYIRDEKHKGYEVRLAHLLPMLALPLLVLMSVGIGRRFMDYGITAKRLYVLTLNLWFYAVAVGLIMLKAHRINWISISFAVLLIITSCHPWNYSNIYRNLLMERIHTQITKYNISIRGMGYEQLRDRILHMPEKDGRILFSSLQDLHRYDYKLFCKEFGADTPCWYGTFETFKGENADRKLADSYEMSYKYDKEDYVIPSGYSHMKHVFTSFQNLHTDDKLSEEDIADQGICCNDSTFIYCNSDFGHITIPFRCHKDNQSFIVPIHGHDAKFMITELDIHDSQAGHTDMTFSLEGYIFYK